MTENDVTLGEIARAVARIERSVADARQGHHAQIQATNVALGKLSEKMDTYIVPIAVVQDQMRTARADLDRLDIEMRDMGKQAAKVSVLGTVAALIAAVVPWPWKH